MDLVLADSYANTIAGAIAPAISIVGVALAGWIAKQIGKHNEQAKETAKKATVASETIEGVIRNGVTERLDRLERGQTQILAQIDNLENSPPPELS